LLALRAYAEAIESLADAKDFDGTGLAQVSNGAASLAGALSAPGALVSAAKTAGGAMSAFAAFIVDRYRLHEIKAFVREADPHVSRAVESLRAYLVALEDEGTLASRRRDIVMRAIESRREASGEMSPLADFALGCDLARNADDRLTRFRTDLDDYRSLLASVREAHAGLAAAAGSYQGQAPARKSVVALVKILRNLHDRRNWED